MSENQSIDVWYGKSIEKIRVDSSPGGVALTPDEARELRNELETVIEEADSDG